MIEITLTEIVFLVWAGLATAAWLSAREDAKVSKKVLVMFIENPEARTQIIKAHEDYMRRKGEEA